MKKSELIESLARRQRLPVADVDLAVNLLLDAIAAGLATGRRTEIRGFGVFDVRYRKARVGRNPKTGGPVAVPAKASPHFKAGKELREAVLLGNLS